MRRRSPGEAEAGAGAEGAGGGADFVEHLREVAGGEDGVQTLSFPLVPSPRWGGLGRGERGKIAN